jgi:hypothetical protein
MGQNQKPGCLLISKGRSPLAPLSSVLHIVGHRPRFPPLPPGRLPGLAWGNRSTCLTGFFVVPGRLSIIFLYLCFWALSPRCLCAEQLGA